MPKRESDLSRKLAHVIKPRGGAAAQLEDACGLLRS